MKIADNLLRVTGLCWGLFDDLGEPTIRHAPQDRGGTRFLVTSMIHRHGTLARQVKGEMRTTTMQQRIRRASLQRSF